MAYVLSFSQAKKLVLDRLRTVMREMPVSEREMPRYVINFKSYSILDLITQVEMETDVGRAFVYDEVKRLNYIIG